MKQPTVETLQRPYGAWELRERDNMTSVAIIFTIEDSIAPKVWHNYIIVL